jgi:hypothetical protein
VDNTWRLGVLQQVVVDATCQPSPRHHLHVLLFKVGTTCWDHLLEDSREKYQKTKKTKFITRYLEPRRLWLTKSDDYVPLLEVCRYRCSMKKAGTSSGSAAT